MTDDIAYSDLSDLSDLSSANDLYSSGFTPQEEDIYERKKKQEKLRQQKMKETIARQTRKRQQKMKETIERQTRKRQREMKYTIARNKRHRQREMKQENNQQEFVRNDDSSDDGDDEYDEDDEDDQHAFKYGPKLTTEELKFVREYGPSLQKSWGYWMGPSGDHINFELKTHSNSMGGIQHVLTDPFFRNLDTALRHGHIRFYDLNSKARMSGEVLAYPKIVEKQTLIRDFVLEGDNESKIQAFANYELNSNSTNTIGFATLVFAAKAILAVKNNQGDKATRLMEGISKMIKQMD